MKFGIIGLGNHAIRRVMPAIRKSGSSVTAIYSRSPEKAEKVASEYGAASFSDIRKMLDGDIDAVYVASPNALHHEHALKVINAEKDLLLEKPMTLNYDDALEVVKEASDHRVALGIGFHLRAHPAVPEIKEAIRKGKIGEISMIEASWSGFSSRDRTLHPDSMWWSESKMVGAGSVMGTGVHVLDALNNILGSLPDRLACIRNPKGSEIERTSSINLQYGKAIAHAVSSRDIFLPDNSISIYGTEGSIQCNRFFSGEIKASLNINGKMKRFTSGDVYRKMVDAFVAYAGKKSSVIATGRDGAAVVRITEAALYSDKKGTPMELTFPKLPGK